MAAAKDPLIFSMQEFSRATDFPFIGINSKGIILELNKEAEKILEQKKKQLIGQPLTNFLTGPSQKKLERIIHSPKHFKKFKLQIEFKTKEGRLKTDLIFLPLYKNSKQPAYFLLSFKNPHKAAKLRVEIDAANRIADLNMKRLHTSNLKLQEARKAEQLAIKAKEHFFASISHEIRTPLNGILGITRLLAETQLNTKQKEFIEAVLNSSEQLLKIINDLLDLSRINSFDFKLESEEFNLHQSLQTIVPVFNILATSKQLAFEVYIDPEAPHYIFGDKYRLNQVINNLLNNAFKFTHQGKVSFTVNVKNINDKSEVVLEFKVCDTGIGIDKENISKVFDTFTPASANTSKQYGGTGLGLSISKHLVELMQGSIQVESVIGKGTCFTFEIPYTYTKKSTAINPYEVKNKSIRYAIKILAVDDNEVNRFYILNLFNKPETIIKTAENGQECIDILQSENFDIILLDLQMPVLNGYKTAEIIRKKLKLNTPIIALTAASVSKEESKCLQAGMNKVLQKPFSKDALLEALSGLLPQLKPEPAIQENIDQLETSLNLEMIYSIIGNNKEKLIEFLHTSIKNIDTEAILLEEALSVSNLEQVKAIAHKLKSTFGLFGVTEVHEGLNKLEELCLKKERVELINNDYHRMKPPILQTRQELVRVIKVIS